jgi:hypothetical protein
VVSSGGDFDDSKGGMIVLWDLNIFVRFPAGSTVMLTSGDCTHFNVPVGRNKTRWSMTQYMSGPLITWVRRGFRRGEDLSKEECSQEKQASHQLSGQYLYSTVASLEEDCRQLLNAEGSFL